jgi:hypothetical protein
MLRRKRCNKADESDPKPRSRSYVNSRQLNKSGKPRFDRGHCKHASPTSPNDAARTTVSGRSNSPDARASISGDEGADPA